MATLHDDFGNPTRRLASRPPWWNPRFWSRRVWIFSGVIVIVIIVVAVVAGVLASKNSSGSSSGAYPNYSPLSYQLQDTIGVANFFDNFNYREGYDPAHGFVHYNPEAAAKQRNLTGTSSDDKSVYLRVDTTGNNETTGRHSVRIESKKQYDKGLFIFDIQHTPYGCGTWPALWLTDPEPSHWPSNGEIDIMEATNNGVDGNAMTLHTSSQCSMDVRRNMTGSAGKTNCDVKADGNSGCGVSANKASYGEEFNQQGGGIMAVEWRDAGIRMWQFARGAIPSDITNKTPKPETWGVAVSDFPSTSCNIGSHFKNNSIVANIDLCGDLLNGKQGAYATSGCPLTCEKMVAEHPEAFDNAYWKFGDFLVYQAS